jgi:hypothetical protein
LTRARCTDRTAAAGAATVHDRWLLVAAGGVREERDLDDWVGRGVAFARSLHPRGDRRPSTS